ncbi:unnamed protein product [Ceratitis capitata]|uniref:(Mediterranean fruit fly) hypothetical protein n=1 Tax=Ceratitis capitata TaxID=7213 RepID=A0A811UA32_CERCA|nr:unnamed protein product [Ceratitis capitata]
MSSMQYKPLSSLPPIGISLIHSGVAATVALPRLSWVLLLSVLTSDDLMVAMKQAATNWMSSVLASRYTHFVCRGNLDHFPVHTNSVQRNIVPLRSYLIPATVPTTTTITTVTQMATTFA